MKEESKEYKFSVYGLTVTDKDQLYSDWSDGLTVYVTKNGVTLELTPEEILQIIKASGLK